MEIIIGSNFAHRRPRQAAAASRDGMDSDLGADPFLERRNVRDNSDNLAVLLKRCEGLQSGIEGIFIKGSKAFIKKE